MHTSSEGFVDANGVSLHYALAGAGRSVVLLHELGGTLNSWDGVVLRLAEHFRVLRYDRIRTNMLHMLPKLRCPVMVIAGRHDTVRPHAGSAELAKKGPGARFELIDDGGHFLPTQALGALTALLEKFLPQ